MITQSKGVLYEHDSLRLLDDFVEFIGENKIKRCIASARKSIRAAPQVLRGYYQQNTFRWWTAFDEYFNLKHGKQQQLSEYVIALAKDANQFLDLKSGMPRNVLNKYRGEFASILGAPSHMFEIRTAWHFWRRGFTLQWQEDCGVPIPEFVVTTQDFSFEVECKELQIDSYRKIGRKDFAHLANAIIDELRSRNLKGSASILLDNPLNATNAFISQIRLDIRNAFLQISGSSKRYPWGLLTLDVSTASGEVIDFYRVQREYQNNAPIHAHSMFYARKDSYGQSIDLIHVKCQCATSDQVLIGILSTLQAAAKQLANDQPGLICFYIPEIENFSGLENDSALNRMTSELFSSATLNHVAGVMYSSEQRQVKLNDGWQSFAEALIFKNPNCRLPKATQFQYLGS